MRWLRPIALGWMCAACAFAVGQQQAADTTPPSVKVLYEDSQALIRKGELAQAQRLLLRAHAEAPGSTRVTIALGKLDAMLGQPKDAVALFRSVEVLAPDNTDNQVNLAIALATEGDLPAALVSAQRAVQSDAQSAPAHHILARVLAALGRNQQAQPEFDRGLALAPQDTGILYDYAIFCEEEADFAHEVQLLSRLTKRVPGNAEDRFLLGRAENRLGDTAAARAELTEAVRLDPNHRAALYLLASLLRKDDPSAAAAYNARFRALQASEEELNAMRDQGNAGVAAMSRGAWSEAIRIFQEALAHCAGCVLEANLQKDLGLAQCQAGDFSGGLTSLQRALALNPRDAETLQAIQAVEAANAQKRK